MCWRCSLSFHTQTRSVETWNVARTLLEFSMISSCGNNYVPLDIPSGEYIVFVCAESWSSTSWPKSSGRTGYRLGTKSTEECSGMCETFHITFFTWNTPRGWRNICVWVYTSGHVVSCRMKKYLSSSVLLLIVESRVLPTCMARCNLMVWFSGNLLFIIWIITMQKDRILDIIQ